MSIARQLTVPLPHLLSKLSDNGIVVRDFDVRGGKLYLFEWKVDPFPFAEREWAWYPLIVKDGQSEIDRDVVEAVLRHVWHSVLPFFEDELEAELKPQGSHEQEIADKVDAKAKAVQGGSWGEDPLGELRESLSFDLSEEELDYLELRLSWRQDTQTSG